MGRRIRLLIVALPTLVMGSLVVTMVRGELRKDNGVAVVVVPKAAVAADSALAQLDDLAGPDLVAETVRAPAPQFALPSDRPYVVRGRVETEPRLVAAPLVRITGLRSGRSLELVGDNAADFAAELPEEVFGGGFEIVVNSDEFHDTWIQRYPPGVAGGELFVTATFQHRLPCMFGTVFGEGGPIGGARVTALTRDQNQRFESVTLEDGSFVISEIAEGAYSFDVFGLCLLNREAYSPIQVGGARRDVDLGNVSVATSGMSFEVVVTLEGVPRSDAVVRWGGRETRTNGQGWARVETCDATPRYLGCSWSPPGESASALHGSKNDVSAANSPLIEIELKRSGLVFEFVNGETGEPAIAGPNVVVKIKGPSTNAKNTYKRVGSKLRLWAKWDDGRYSFTITTETFKEVSFEIDVVAEDYVDLENFLPVTLWPLE